MARIHLHSTLFEGRGRPLVESAAGQVTAFRYDSGVEALRVTCGRTELALLPFRGQQIWRYAVDGEDLTMRTHFDEPMASTSFGESYGAFLLHCGLSGTGHPGPHDTHLHHGELPAAALQSAWIDVAEGERPELSLGGSYRHRVSHSYDYVFTTRLTLRPDRPSADLEITIENRRAAELRYSYLCHINWPIWDGGRLLQTLPLDAAHFTLAPDAGQDAATAEYTDRLAADPTSGDVLTADLHLLPEYCAVLTPVPDADGRAHFAQLRPDGRAAFVSYDTHDLPHAVRWISSTGDESAAGFCLPATGHHLGRARSEADGMVRTVAPGASVSSRVSFGLLGAADADRLRATIEAVR